MTNKYRERWQKERERQIRDALPLWLEFDMLCCELMLTYAIHGGDNGDFSWYITIHSVAPSERWTSREQQELSHVFSRAIEHLKEPRPRQ